MGRPEKEVRCKKHPNHNNINGICPYCLRDRLAHLSGSSTANAASSSSCSEYSSYDESESSSSLASPARAEQRSRSRLLELLKGRNKKVLRSSKSFTLSEEAEKNKIRKGAGKILAKFGMAGVGDGRLTHSKTVKEKKSSKWAFFSLIY